MTVLQRIKLVVAKLLRRAAHEYEDDIDTVSAAEVHEAITNLRALLPAANDIVNQALAELFPQNENSQLSEYRSYHKVLAAVQETFVLNLLMPLCACDLFATTNATNVLSDEQFVEHVDNFVFVFYEKSLHDTLEPAFVIKMWNSVDAMKEVAQETELVLKEEWLEIPAWRALVDN